MTYLTQKILQYGSLAVTTTEIRMTILIPRQQIEVLSKRLWHGNYVAVEPAYQQLQQDLIAGKCSITELLEQQDKEFYAYTIRAEYQDGSLAVISKLKI